MTATTIPGISEAVGKRCADLVSDAALASINRDPYWPKWDSPCWLLNGSRLPFADAISQLWQ